MELWLERVGESGLATALTAAEVSLALTLLATVLHFRRLRRGGRDLKAVLLYFIFFFALLLAIPCLITVLAASEPAAALSFLGLTLGRTRLGLLILTAGIPVAIVAGFIGSRDPEMQRLYPFSKTACTNLATFMLYEASYLILYYLAWEFAFRGLLFFPFIPAIGLLPALAVQTIASTLYHLGHPDSEVFAAFGAGFAFGLIAYATHSILYTTVLHAAAGISTDTFLYLRTRSQV
jgi:membrane protease YdiL (CAAX protease family)